MKIPHNKPTLGAGEAREMQLTLESSWIGPGPRVKSFEQDVCTHFGIESGNAVAVSSGTAALFLAIWALNSNSQHVAIPAFGCVALTNSVRMAGLMPTYIDSLPGDPNPDIHMYKDAAKSLNVITNTFGLPVHVPDDNYSGIVQDISHALGSQVDGIQVGLNGEIAIASLAATKMITTGGQGGIIFSKNLSLIEKIRDYVEFDSKVNNKVSRFNFQMTDIQAAIGSVQLRRLDEFIARRQEIFDIYISCGIPLANSEHLNSYAAKYRAVYLSRRSSETIANLSEMGISAISPYAFEEMQQDTNLCISAVNWGKNAVSLPIYPSLSDAHAEYIARTVCKIENF